MVGLPLAPTGLAAAGCAEPTMGVWGFLGWATLRFAACCCIATCHGLSGATLLSGLAWTARTMPAELRRLKRPIAVEDLNFMEFASPIYGPTSDVGGTVQLPCLAPTRQGRNWSTASRASRCRSCATEP